MTANGRKKGSRAGVAATPSNRSMSPKPPRLGAIVQGLRAERNLTLDKLSQIAGVSKSMLSEIERDKANPTIAVAWRLANALDIGLDRLLTKGQRTLEKISVSGSHETPSLINQDDKYSLRILGPMELGGRFEWYEIVLDSGGAIVSKAHDPGTKEHLTLLRGSVEVTAGDTRRLLRPGDTARYFADQPHAIRNVGKAAASALLVVVHT
jgi:XRE family transcriptional regulator, regulator of sulfur utilization